MGSAHNDAQHDDRAAAGSETRGRELPVLRSPRAAAIRRALALGWVIAATPAAAQQLTSARAGESPYFVPRIDGSIVLDGRADEAAWQAIEPLPAIMHVPTFRAEPTERTGVPHRI